MTLRIVLALIALFWFAEAKAGCDEAIYPDHKSTETYTLWFWSYNKSVNGWLAANRGLTKDECLNQLEHLHFRGEAMAEQIAGEENDPNRDKHQPYCSASGPSH